MYNCLAGCAAEYKCGPLMLPGPAGQQAESFAPWVWVQFGEGAGENDKITVGNDSYKANPNTAIIKSFEVGFIDTPKTIIEIVDEAGGRMGALIDSIRKCATSAGEGTKIKCQFGWVYATCDGTKQVIPSPLFKSQIMQTEVSYSEGKIKYMITGEALVPVFEGMREDNVKGEDDKQITIEEAINNLCNLPPAIRVRYCEITNDGKLKDVKFKWKNFKEGGPKGTWQGDNMNRQSVITKWLEPFRLDDGSAWGKGIIPFMNPQEYDELILLKDPTLNPEETKECTERSLGTFIVNGGKCSTVIEFTPTFNWIKGQANFSAGGGTSGAANTGSNFQEDKKVNQQEKDHGPTAGLQQQVTITQQAWNAYGPKNAYQETMRSQQAHSKAHRLTDVAVQEIIADLKILGDPREPFCSIQAGRIVSIVAINPFHIQGGSNKGCGDWLAIPGCNQILSNKAWLVVGVNHSIKEGSYTTTLKVQLNAPGQEQGSKEPLGGSGSGGKTVKNTC